MLCSEGKGDGAVTVYADIVFAVNCVVDFLLLFLAARLCGSPTRLPRLFAAASFGGMYAVAVFLPWLGWLSEIAGQALSFLLMAGIAYGFRRQTLRPAAVLILCASALAGVMLMLSRTFFPALALSGGIYYPVTARMLLLLAGVFSAAAALLTSDFFRHSGTDYVPLELTLCGRTVRVTSLRDTGNTLADPVTGEPVVVISRQTAEELLQTRIAEETLLDPIAALKALQKRCPQVRFRLLPYRAVGVPSGLLLAAPCSARVGGRRTVRVLTALSPTSVSGTGGCEALMGGTL